MRIKLLIIPILSLIIFIISIIMIFKTDYPAIASNFFSFLLWVTIAVISAIFILSTFKNGVIEGFKN